MKSSLSETELCDYLAAQLGTFFPDKRLDRGVLDKAVGEALLRLEHCFLHVGQRYYRRDGQAIFNHLNTDQYAAFLYLCSNVISRSQGDDGIADKLYGLNKAMHGIDVFHAVELPDVFCFVHPVGTVIGRASFGNYFCAYQNVTVGGDLDGNHPCLGTGVVMYGGSRVIGKSTIGNNVLISAGTSIIAQTVADDCSVRGTSPHLHFHATRRNVVADVFEDRS